jgi:hypothetical protein
MVQAGHVDDLREARVEAARPRGVGRDAASEREHEDHEDRAVLEDDAVEEPHRAAEDGEVHEEHVDVPGLHEALQLPDGPRMADLVAELRERSRHEPFVEAITVGNHDERHGRVHHVPHRGTMRSGGADACPPWRGRPVAASRHACAFRFWYFRCER